MQPTVKVIDSKMIEIMSGEEYADKIMKEMEANLPNFFKEHPYFKELIWLRISQAYKDGCQGEPK